MDRKKKKRVAAAAIVIAAIVLFLSGPFLLTFLARDFLVAQIADRLKASVSVDRLEVSFFPPKIVLEGIAVKPSSGPLEYVGVRKAAIIPGTSSIFLGRVALKTVEIDEPTLRIDLGAAIPKERSDVKEGFRLPTLKDLIRVELQDVKVRGAKLALRLPGGDFRLNVDAGNATFQGKDTVEHWSWKGSGALYRGEKSVKMEHVEIDAERHGKNIELKTLKVEGIGMTVAMRGAAYPEADLFLQVRSEIQSLDAAMEDLAVIPSRLHTAGKIRAEGRLKGAWDDLKWSGEFRGSDLHYGTRTLPRLAFSFRLKQEMLEAASGEADFGGGVARFTVSSIRRRGVGRFTVAAEGVPYEVIHRWMKPNDPRPDLSGAISVQADGEVGWSPALFRGRYQVTVPNLALSLPASLGPYLPLTFRNVGTGGAFSWKSGEPFRIEGGEVKGEGFKGKYGFAFAPGGNGSGEWSADVTDVRSVFPQGDLVSGEGNVTGGLKYSRSAYRVILGLHIDPLRYRDLPPAKFDGELLFADRTVEMKSFRFGVKHGEAVMDGKVPFRSAPDQTMKMSVLWKDVDLGWVSAVASRRYSWVGKAEGDATGNLELAGHEAHPTGHLRTSATLLAWQGIPLREAQVDMEFRESGLLLRDASVFGEALKAKAKGEFEGGDWTQLVMEAEKVPLIAFGVPAPVLSFASQVGGKIVVQKDAVGPKVDAQFQLFSEGSPTSQGSLLMSGPLSDLGWELTMEEDKLIAQGRINADDFSRLEAQGKLSSFSLKPWMKAESAVTGTFEIVGSPRRKNSWNGEFGVESFRVERGEWYTALAEPVRISISNGDFDVPSSRFVGPSTEFQAQGNVSRGRIDARASGGLALQVFTLFPWRIARAEGTAEVAARVTGTVDQPQLSGSFALKEGFVQFRGFPHSLEDLEVIATFEQQRISFDRFRARVSDGTVQGNGHLKLVNPLDDSTIELDARVEKVEWRFPTWLPARVSGRLALVGPLLRPLLRGDIVAHEAVYRDDWDWKSRILTFRSGSRVARVFHPGEEHVRFDILMRSEGDSLALNNDIATGKMRGQVRLGGSDLAIGLEGRIDVISGKVNFLDNQFQIASGTVGFEGSNPVRVNFDVTAKTKVSQTDITLDLRSEKGEVTAFLSSVPSKDETNILTLLTLGVDTDELAASGGANPAVSTSLLPSVLTAPVQSRLETGLKKAGLIDTFQFVPSFSEDTKTTGLKMVIGKQLLPKVRLLYSTDLYQGGEENNVRLEQQFNDHVSIQGNMTDNKDETSDGLDLGVDLEFKTEF